MNRLQAYVSFLLTLVCFCASAYCAELATLTGYVTDPAGLRISHSRVQLTNIETNISYIGETNEIGLYRISDIPIGQYRVVVQRSGFKTIVKQGIELHVQDVIALNFQLDVGSVAESVNVEGGSSLVNTESTSVSTVVDRKFAESLPLNGRSFQSLIELTPGVVLTTNYTAAEGQFSVNGQRANSNYWTVDGVSANVGIGTTGFGGDAVSGSLGAFSVQGGTNSLVSVDAMQEFRIQTSTFAPEFGRTPGGQISIVTRPGTNTFHGSVFDYLRNDALDAKDWFTGFKNSPALPKPPERQNDFGGTFSGPLIPNKTFFFFSYEGLRLRLPQVALTTVPTLATRQAAPIAMQAILNSYPLPSPTGTVFADGSAQLSASYSNQSTLDSSSLRLDHKLSDRLNLFARYSYSPSELLQRPGPSSGFALSVLQRSFISLQTATLGATWTISPTIVDDVRINHSRNIAKGNNILDTFGNAKPYSDSDLVLPLQRSLTNSQVFFFIPSLSGSEVVAGTRSENVQRQWNVVDSLSWQKSSHTIKFGVDQRRLTPVIGDFGYRQQNFFANLALAKNGQGLTSVINSSNTVPLLLQDLGAFAQDTWRFNQRLTLTYGLRWDIGFSPTTTAGAPLPSVLNFNDLSSLALAPPGTPVFEARFGNFAPRLGIAYQIAQQPGWESILRGGWGLFFDVATAQLGTSLSSTNYPFGSQKIVTGAYPISASAAAPAPISPAGSSIFALDPKLKNPYTQQWNVTFEQALGGMQSLSLSYVGALGRHLLQQEAIAAPNPNISGVFLVSNYGTSDYHALQIQLRRPLARGLQALASYSWAHSIDTASTGAGGLTFSDKFSRKLGADENRGPSDFDIRDSASIALTYDIPLFKSNRLVTAIANRWSFQNIFQARSAEPVDVSYQSSFNLAGTQLGVRPDITQGIPLYLFGPQYPGGKAFNSTVDPSRPGCKGPFCKPPLGSNNQPLQQGNLGRNALRGFGAWQWDFALHREFPIIERVKLQFRAELFNLLNHPNFAAPVGNVNSALFGQSTQMFANGLSVGNQGSGGFNPLYQIGGPRSAQFALKLLF